MVGVGVVWGEAPCPDCPAHTDDAWKIAPKAPMVAPNQPRHLIWKARGALLCIDSILTRQHRY